ncbi:MAG: phosphate acyltransferase, partial [Gemmatimonadota bacterium]
MTAEPGDDFLARLHRGAAATGARIGFPEAREPRTAEAMRVLERERLVIPVEIETGAANGEAETRDGLAVAMERLAAGALEGVVAGAAVPTARVIRAALRSVGVAHGMRTVSSAFYMVLAQPFESRHVLTFTDPAVLPRPTADQLAESAEAACRARRAIVGDEPLVAFLSYSTHGSAAGEEVARVREAVERFHALRPDVAADGELQADAALVGEVGRRKAPGSPVAGRANVLVFPDLDAANIAYKLVERLAGARALGPILQGLRRPVNDLSRGASVDDIVDVACITALMARTDEER